MEGKVTAKTVVMEIGCNQNSFKICSNRVCEWFGEVESFELFKRLGFDRLERITWEAVG